MATHLFEPGEEAHVDDDLRRRLEKKDNRAELADVVPARSGPQPSMAEPTVNLVDLL